MTNFRLTRQLWAAYGKETPNQPTTPSDDVRRLVARRVLEQALRTAAATTGLTSSDLLEGTLARFDTMYGQWGQTPLPDQDLVATATELANLLEAAYGAGVSHGLPMDEVFAEVCLSDLTKADGERRSDGSSYQPPDVARILEGGAACP